VILGQVDGSLRRLGTDYVDLLQIHRFDPDVPVEETMETVHDVVKAGKARYLGASSDVGLALRQDAAHRRHPRLDHVHLHAGPVQPAGPRGGARDVRPARRPARDVEPQRVLRAAHNVFSGPGLAQALAAQFVRER
jgi:hypothetical protein